MYIDKIEINNFRIYYGQNTITIAPSADGNICVIGGDNGSGKTTLITALVWCLYGSQMQEVDSIHKKRIMAAGGYRKYLVSTLNKRAALNGESTFSVGIELKNLNLLGIQSGTLRITRQCDINNPVDSLSIAIDGQISELVDDFGQQMFVNEFVLPKEVAKFFFFDAEKIVEIAEMQSIQDKRILSQAYSEVLGLKKYEDLRSSLNDLRVRFRKDSVTGAEKKQFQELRKDIEKVTGSIELYEQQKESLANTRSDLKTQSDILQEKLLKEGNALSLSELQKLRNEKQISQEENKRLSSEFKDLLEYAPFAIAGSLLLSIKHQLDTEDRLKRALDVSELVRDRINVAIDKLRNDRSDFAKKIDHKTKQYYINKVSGLLEKLVVVCRADHAPGGNRFIHDFSLDGRNKFEAILLNLRSAYNVRLRSLTRAMKANRSQFSDVSSRLATAETLEADDLVKNIRSDKTDVDQQIDAVEQRTMELSENIGALRSVLANKRRLFDQISSKIEVNEKYKDKDKLVTRLVQKLDDFIVRMKDEKKSSLEARILSNLDILMHKKDFVFKVSVKVDNDMLDIILVNRRGEEIRKDDLSKGEQQLYATAILKSLVEESNVDFPVFIDSPLQKFDDKHAKNIIMRLYPHISSQVVILPLPHKELSAREYGLLREFVASVYMIDNYGEDSSRFVRIASESLFDQEIERAAFATQ